MNTPFDEYKWTAGFSPRGALAPPSARPRKLLRLRNETCLNRIPFDITPDTIKLRIVSNDAIEVLLLPELFAGSSQQEVSQVSRRSLDAPNQFRNRCSRRAQQMHMVRHNNEGIQRTKPASVYLAQLRLRRVKQPIPSHKRFAGTQVFPLENALGRKATPKAPSNKGRHPGSVDMRQTATIASHISWCSRTATILHQARGAKASRGLKPAVQCQCQ